MNKPVRDGGSCALQGCLFGAVGLFVALLVTMIILAAIRFREQTADPAPEPVAPAALAPAATNRLG